MEPSLRMKELVQMSHNIHVDKNISISKYFNSGRELIKSAAAFEQKGDIEKAFVLYLRYMTLFIEKIKHHPEYNQADKAEKALVKTECNNVFDRAEDLKKRIMENYASEFEQSKGKNETAENIQKRSIEPQGCSSKNCDVDDIDRRFDFSQGPTESQQDKAFDPFNIEELKNSFKTSND